jgi:hypothetical protein
MMPMLLSLRALKPTTSFYRLGQLVIAILDPAKDWFVGIEESAELFRTVKCIAWIN